MFSGLNFEVNRGDKIAVIGKDSLAITALFQVINDQVQATSGEFSFGPTITHGYLPNDLSTYFDGVDLNLIDWLRQFTSDPEHDEVYLRGFLGKMLFSGEESLKKSSVLSGGEKVRCMLSRIMLAEANLLILDEPTNHLDLETITTLNNSLANFKGTVLFTSHDHTFTQTVANRIIEISPNGLIDSLKTYDEYFSDERIVGLRKELYEGVAV